MRLRVVTGRLLALLLVDVREQGRGIGTLLLRGAFNGSMQHEPDEEVSWCDDVARA